MKTARSVFAVLVLVGLVGACGGAGTRPEFVPLDHDPIFRLPPADPEDDTTEPPPANPPPSPAPVLLDLTTFEQAIAVVGQTDFLGQFENRGGGPAANSLHSGGSVLAAGSASAVSENHLWVADQFNNRILRYPLPLGGQGPDADIVLGQLAMTTANYGLSEGDFTNPSDVEVSNGKLLICDRGNNRIVIYNQLPTQTGDWGQVAVGQPNLYTGTSATTASGMTAPNAVCVANGKLLVADTGNNRVMIWNQVPQAHGVAANIVLGQPNFSTSTARLSASGMNEPTGVWSDGTKVVVCDSRNHRILIWNSFPQVDGQPADMVLGQPDMTSTTTNQFPGSGWPHASPHPDILWHPLDVESNGVQIVVSDSNMHRVLIWNVWPAANHERPHIVLGQSNFFQGWPNDDDQNNTLDGVPSDRTFFLSSALQIDGKRLYVSDPGNHRLLVFGE